MTTDVIHPHSVLLDLDGELLIRRGDEMHLIESSGLSSMILALLSKSDAGRLSLPEDLAHEAAERVRALLLKAGMLTADLGDGTASTTARAFALQTSGEPGAEEIDRRLHATRFHVVGVGALTDALAAALTEEGLEPRVHSSDEEVAAVMADPDGALVVVGRHLADPLLLRSNEEGLRTGRAWLPVVEYDGRRTRVGPFITPSSSACWECTRLRHTANFPDAGGRVPARRATDVGTHGVPVVTPGHRMLTAGLVLERVLGWTALGEQSGAVAPGRMDTLGDGPSGVEIERHHVLRVPRCPACSPTAGRGLPQIWAHPKPGQGEEA